MNKSIKAALLVRLLVSCVFIVCIYAFFRGAVFSAVVGAVSCLIPEAYQGWKISKTEKEFEPSKWLRLAYQSMISKWLMTAMIFAISFSSSFQWDYKILFAGYLIVSISGLLTPIFIGKSKNVS